MVTTRTTQAPPCARRVDDALVDRVDLVAGTGGRNSGNLSENCQRSGHPLNARAVLRRVRLIAEVFAIAHQVGVRTLHTFGESFHQLGCA